MPSVSVQPVASWIEIRSVAALTRPSRSTTMARKGPRKAAIPRHRPARPAGRCPFHPHDSQPIRAVQLVRIGRQGPEAPVRDVTAVQVRRRRNADVS